MPTQPRAGAGPGGLITRNGFALQASVGWGERPGHVMAAARNGRTVDAGSLFVLCSALSRRLATAQLGYSFRDGLVFPLGGERLSAAVVLP